VGVRQRYPGRAGRGPVLAGLAVVVAACSTAAAPSRALPVPGPRPLAAAPRAWPVLDLARVHADELGAVPVLMHRQIVARAAGDYDQTPAQIRGQLEQLYAQPLPDDHRGRAGGRPGRPAGRDQPDGAHLRRLDLVAVRRAAAAAGARAAARVVLLAAFAQTCPAAAIGE